VRFAQLFPHGGDEASLLVVGLHGRGDTPEGFSGLFSDFPMRAEVVLPQGQLTFNFGWQWFDWAHDIDEAELARRVGEAEAKLWPTLVVHARGRKMIIVGFSQGAVLAYALAARHPDEIVAAFPVSGAFPRPLWPTGESAPVHALHGTADAMLPIDLSREAVKAFPQADLTEFPDVGHTITPEMRDWLWKQIYASTHDLRERRR
jgi:phospholipase/carboxylesterase